MKIGIKLETLEISADEWQLYTATHPYGCERAAREINLQIQVSVNEGDSRRETERLALAVMRTFADLGALDTEPLCVLQDVLDKVHGR